MVVLARGLGRVVNPDEPVRLRRLQAVRCRCIRDDEASDALARAVLVVDEFVSGYSQVDFCGVLGVVLFRER